MSKTIRRENSPPPPKPMLAHCDCDKKSCNGDVVEIVTSEAKEIYIRLDPACMSDYSGSPQQQAQQFYGCLPWILEKAGAKMAHVALERVFFRSLANDFDTFAQVRRDAYSQAGVSESEFPVTSYVEQPPCRPGQAFELQVFALLSHSEETVRVTTIPGEKNDPPAKLIEMSGYKHLYVRDIKGLDTEGRPLDSFRAQSDAMFEKGAELLGRHDTTFPFVLRTWCYLDDIDRDYGEFNLSRNVFFEREGVKRLPASTGIRAGLWPQGTLTGYDLYALLNPEGAEIEIMHTPTLNEADEYGSSFSRGMRLSLPEKTVLFISGTASVDEEGATVHVDDVRQQIERMLLNVKSLLAPHGASLTDLVQVITYLKEMESFDLFCEIAAEWGITNVPNSIVEAGVCRPNLLCEMEAIAILPKLED